VDGTPWLGARGNAIVVEALPVERSASGAALAACAHKPRAEDALSCAADEAIVDDVARTLAVELAGLGERARP
jgi:hypothetical protein